MSYTRLASATLSSLRLSLSYVTALATRSCGQACVTVARPTRRGTGSPDRVAVLGAGTIRAELTAAQWIAIRSHASIREVAAT